MISHIKNILFRLFTPSESLILNRQGDLPARLILLLAACIYFTICICNHYLFRTYCFDYGLYNYVFRDYAHLRVSDCTLYAQPHFNLLQDHVSFVFWLFVPVYWLMGWLFGTYTLMFIQTVLILTGGWFVYRLTGLKTEGRALPLFALLQYLFVYGRWTAFDADCNFAIMASSVVPVFMYYFRTKQFFPMFLVLGFILISREDMPLWTFFLGLFMLVTEFRDRRLRNVSLVVMALSVCYFVTIFAWIIPAFANPYKQYGLFNYSTLGSSPMEAVSFILSHPLKTFVLFFENTTGNPAFDQTKLEFYAIYLICGGYLLFVRPAYLLWFIPILARKMLNDEPLRWSSDTYYSIEFVTLLPVAIFTIIGGFRSIPLRKVLSILVIAGSLGVTVYMLLPHQGRSFFWSEEKHSFYRTSFYRADLPAGRIHKHLKELPADAVVSASASLATQLAWRDRIYVFPRVEKAQFVVVFTDRDFYPYGRTAFDSALYHLRQSKLWTTRVNAYPLLILERNTADTLLPAKWDSDTTLYLCDAEQVMPDGNSFRAAGGLSFGNANAQSMEASYGGKHSVKLDAHAHFGFTAVVSDLKAGERLEVYVWRKGNHSGTRIIADARPPSIYYNADQRVVQKDAGWELLRKDVYITQTWPGQELVLYLWNPTDDPVYFDELKIIRITPQ